MSPLPKISVVIPCFNAGCYLRAALRTVFAQNWPKLEVIVVDDGSSDGSTQIANEFSPVRLVRQANQGVAAARNRGIELATGDLVAFLDADDYWLPGKLHAQWELLKRHAGARMAYGAWVVWPCSDPEPSADYLAALDAESGSVQRWSGPSGWIYPQLLLDCEVWTSTVLAERSLFRDIGAFDNRLPVGEDYDLWLRASRVTEIFRVERPLALYRKHASNTTKSVPAENYEALVISRALKRWGYRSPNGVAAKRAEVNAALARSWRSFAIAHAEVGSWKLARRGAATAVRLDPSHIGGWKMLFHAAMPLGRRAVTSRA